MDLVRAFNESGLFAKMSFLVGFVPFAVALWYVTRPVERTLTFMRPVSLAAIFAGICGLVTGFITILQGLAATPARTADWSRVYMGVSEALVPVFLNFGLLSVAWLLVAIGMWRRAP